VRFEKKGDGIDIKEFWANNDKSVQFNSPIVKDGMLYGLSAQNELFCLDEKTGKQVWAGPTLASGVAAAWGAARPAGGPVALEEDPVCRGGPGGDGPGAAPTTQPAQAARRPDAPHPEAGDPPTAPAPAARGQALRCGGPAVAGMRGGSSGRLRRVESWARRRGHRHRGRRAYRVFLQSHPGHRPPGPPRPMPPPPPLASVGPAHTCLPVFSSRQNNSFWALRP